MTSTSSHSQVHIKAPGRINLIGEHIDYNGGHVLPASIDKHISIKLTQTDTKTCHFYSSTLNSSFSVDIDNLEQSAVEWHNYAIGVLFYIDKLRPHRLSGFECRIESALPQGSGMSYSAALECGLAAGINTLFQLGLTDIEIIELSRDAEHNFVGTKCGIMDQFAVVKGKANALIQLDCKSLEYNLIPFKLKGFKIVLLNTNVSHNLATSEYNLRREECESALQTIQNKYPETNYLTEIDADILSDCQAELSIKEYHRALYVYQEHRRTLEAVELLKQDNSTALGKLLYDSHYGLQHLYEVSCSELDFLVEQAKGKDYVLGARMMA